MILVLRRLKLRHSYLNAYIRFLIKFKYITAFNEFRLLSILFKKESFFVLIRI